MMKRLIGAALTVLGGALVIAVVSSPAPAGKQAKQTAGSPSGTERRGGTLRIDIATSDFTFGFATRLFGGNEVSSDGEAGAGDRDGNGWATVALVGPRRICFSIIVRGVAKPTGAHIHRGGPGTNGPVVVTLRPPTGGNGTSSGCVSAAWTVVRAIFAKPAAFYVNVHTSDFQEGAIRGQL